MKYDSQLAELRNLLPAAKSILIALPTGADTDKLAAGLALFLTFEQQGKEVSIVCEDTLTVGQSHLFGIDHVQKTIPPSGAGGNLTLTLEGVASSNGTIPALEKLDWFAENNNLNLVFHVIPGQTFQPSRIIPKYQGSGFNLIFVIGAANLDSLGSLYRQNAQNFSGVHIVNIDSQNNSQFGQTNVVDTQASSVSEIVAQVLTDLGINLDPDTASNLLTGVFAATSNLTSQRANADTYLVVANCLKAGGKKPGELQAPTQPQLSNLIQPASPYPSQGGPEPVQPVEQYTTPTVVAPTPVTPPVQPAEQPATSANQPSPEERPAQEGVVSETVEPDWLTPKIFKGTNLG